MTIQEYDIKIAQKETQNAEVQKHFKRSLKLLKDLLVKECECLICSMIETTVKENPKITKEIGIDSLKNLKISMNKMKNEVAEKVDKDIANNQKLNSVELTFLEEHKPDPFALIESFVEIFVRDRINEYEKEVNTLLEQYHYQRSRKGYSTTVEMKEVISRYAGEYFQLCYAVSECNSLKKAKEELEAKNLKEKEEQEAENLWKQA